MKKGKKKQSKRNLIASFTIKITVKKACRALGSRFSVFNILFHFRVRQVSELNESRELWIFVNNNRKLKMDDDFKKMMKKLGESNLSLMMEYFEDEVKTKYISRSSAHNILFDKAHITSGRL